MDFEELMAQAQSLQTKVAAAQEELAQMTVRGIAGNGDVIVTMSGKYDMVDIYISDAAASAGSAKLREMTLSALRDAKQKADEVIDRVMSQATAGMPLPE